MFEERIKLVKAKEDSSKQKLKIENYAKYVRQMYRPQVSVKK